MKTRFTVHISVAVLAAVFSAEAAVKYEFNDYTDGQTAGQNGWSIFKKKSEEGAFRIFSGVGFSGTGTDKALVIGASPTRQTLVCPATLSWQSGDTWVLDFDFKVAINSEPRTDEKPILTLALGNPDLKGNFWSCSLRELPTGKWLWKGPAPDHEIIARVPAAALPGRPAGGAAVASSKWLHLKLTLQKLPADHSIKGTLFLTDPSGIIVCSHIISETADYWKQLDLWDSPTLTFGFAASGDPQGLICIDNLIVSSVSDVR